jgi:glutamate-ammonia-ligase adenylyltransferase
MRERIISVNCRSTNSKYDFKLDRGGLLDIEFLLQYLVLRCAHQHPELLDHRDNEKITRALVDIHILDRLDGIRLTDILEKYLATENHLKLQEKPALIASTEFSEERQWVKGLWQRLLGTA